MKRIMQVIVLIGAVFALIGCEALLSFNLFSILDTPETPTVKQLDTMEDSELLETVTELLETDSFMQDVAGDEDIRTAVLENLAEIYDESSDADITEQQQASLLVAEIELNSTAAGEVVDDFVNVMDEILEEPPDSGSPEEFAETVVTAVFADVTEDNFDETLDALLAAAEAYTFYGESLDDTGEVVAPENLNTGAVAQDAIVAILISEIVDVDGAGDQPGLLTLKEFKAIVVDDAPFPEDFAIVENPLEENVALVNILDASGMEDFFRA